MDNLTKSVILTPFNILYKISPALTLKLLFRIKVGYGLAGCIKDKGAYTITAESSGTGAKKWGKLKSGAGWIALDYVKKV